MASEWPNGLDDLNLLAAYEVLEDLNAEFNVIAEGPVEIPLWCQIIRHPELHPGDAPGFRDAYMERRWKITNFLKDKSIIERFEVIEADHRWQNRLLVSAGAKAVKHAFQVCAAEYNRRFFPEPPLTPEPSGAPSLLADVNPPSKPAKRFSVVEWIFLVSAIATIIGLPATWMSVPGFQEWAKHVIGIQAQPKALIAEPVQKPDVRRPSDLSVAAVSHGQRAAPKQPKESPNSLRKRTLKLADDLGVFLAERFARTPEGEEERRQYDEATNNIYLNLYKSRTVGILQELQAKGLDIGILNASGAAPVRYLAGDELRQLSDLAYHLDANDKVVSF